MGFVVDKVALGQVILRVVGFPLSISFHWCSINCKKLVNKLLIFIIFIGVAQKALRLWCEGPSQKKKRKEWTQIIAETVSENWVTVLTFLSTVYCSESYCSRGLTV
jgi:hypothetical protein